ncbi:hypothetical protein K450DRAFT_251065 [Umbelopsis ramanniana AG]|uniref:Uncharacterized protein n=1 Tax=Umbelopsis ramanniana AG TaxID=1314678 RepID=A0AAD5E8P2_UMBRA|nr:uncharacterized protein K450DRAFT_251065 [Umbelopsis ramanniana AG]KAI8577645.1 hypothetical protein K450DRAFT_251065 [Umbelopsis ramanniana AG]
MRRFWTGLKAFRSSSLNSTQSSGTSLIVSCLISQSCSTITSNLRIGKTLKFRRCRWPPLLSRPP